MFKIDRLEYVDTHTMGEPTRIIVDGIPPILGNSMAEKKEYLEDNFDYIRRMAMDEPRGHRDMFGAIITDPIHEEAHIGVIFMDGGGYLNMCGHGTMGVATFLVEREYVKVTEPYTHLVLDAPAGLIGVKVRVEKGKVLEVSLTNVPSFVYKRDVEVYLPEIGKVSVDISFGGSFFALVKAEDLGLKVSLEYIEDIMKLGVQLRDEINKEVVVTHPNNPHINKVDLVEIYDEPTNSDADLKNVVVFGRRQFDRSPCGTGTSAKLAALYEKGQLGLEETFVYESITGTKFKGKVVEETKIGEYNGIIPEVTGRAFITSYGYLVYDEEDPFKYGFILNK